MHIQQIEGMFMVCRKVIRPDGSSGVRTVCPVTVIAVVNTFGTLPRFFNHVRGFDK